MDPISISGLAPTASLQRDQAIPSAPEAADVEEFKSIYFQDAARPAIDPGMESLSVSGPPAPGAEPPESVFRAALLKLADSHEVGCRAMEEFMASVGVGAAMGPAELIKVQISVGQAVTGMATAQSFDKKTDDGVKALMTGQ